MQKDIHLHILSKDAANNIGIKYYVGKNPCLRGHLFFRNMRSECMLCKTELNELWRHQNPGKHNASNRNRDPQSDVLYKERNRLTLNLRAREYRKANQEHVSTISRNSRAKRKCAEGRHTKSDILRILKLQKERCATCYIKLIVSGPGKYHVDHIYALASGGSNNPSNLQMLCPRCNLKKNTKDPIIWQQKHGKLL